MPSCAYPSGAKGIMVKIQNIEAITKAVAARLEKMQPEFKSAVEVEKETVITRSKAGIDVAGKNFKAYSDNEKWKGKNWKDVRRSEGFQIGYVDLTYSDDMFKAMKVVFGREGFKFLATIFFDNLKQSQKAKGHQTGQLGKNKYEPRKFFGLSQSQRESIVSKLRNVK